jgi:hypothetical protein
LRSPKPGDGKPKTGRRYYYLALSHGYISPDMSATVEGKRSRDAAYKRVTAVLGVIRMQGRLGWHMVLDLTRELVRWRTCSSPREARKRMRQTYTEDKWSGQPCFPIMVVEKDTLVPVCEPMAERWQMPFASSRGYGSLTLQHDTAAMLRGRLAQHREQSVIVYFVSDHDPSGFDLQRAWEDALADFDIRATFVRIALTLGQVRDTDCQSASKPSDSRSKAYVDRYGERCWEADILPASIIERDLDLHIEGWLDRKQWKRRNAEIERARKLL